MSINKQLLHEKCLSCVSLNLLRDLDKNYFIILGVLGQYVYTVIHTLAEYTAVRTGGGRSDAATTTTTTSTTATAPHWLQCVFTHYLHTAASAGRWRRGNIILRAHFPARRCCYLRSGNNSAGLGMSGVYCNPASLRLSPTRVRPIPHPLSELQLSNRTVKSLNYINPRLNYINPNFGGSPQY